MAKFIRISVICIFFPLVLGFSAEENGKTEVTDALILLQIKEENLTEQQQLEKQKFLFGIRKGLNQGNSPSTQSFGELTFCQVGEKCNNVFPEKPVFCDAKSKEEICNTPGFVLPAK